MGDITIANGDLKLGGTLYILLGRTMKKHGQPLIRDTHTITSSW
jgi:hypothetical protein